MIFNTENLLLKNIRFIFVISLRLLFMKMVFLFSLLAVLPTLSFGQEVYKSFLEEGKVWKYRYHSPNDMVYDTFLAVKGDTLIDDISYMKIVDVESGRCDYVMREDGGKVYCRYCSYQDGSESLVYDFGLNVGDSFNTSDVKAMVVAVDTITANGHSFRALDVREENSTQPNWWVEGIGSMNYLTSSLQNPGNYYNFLECQLGEDILFSQTEFRTLRVPSVIVGGNKTVSSTVYDLQGRHISGQPYHGIYIKNLKKYAK